jgi:hypothetical protein
VSARPSQQAIHQLVTVAPVAAPDTPGLMVVLEAIEGIRTDLQTQHMSIQDQEENQQQMAQALLQISKVFNKS